MKDPAMLEAYLAAVTQRFGIRESHAVFAQFMCRCLMLVRRFLPGVGLRALDLGNDFWLEGRGEADRLLAARIECWSYLDAKGRSIDIQDPEDAAMRALICVLYTEPEADESPAETVRWFADMFNRLGHGSEETNRFMDV